MKIKKRKPDLILTLAILVGIGVVFTMKAHMGFSKSTEFETKVNDVSVYQNAWNKFQQ